MDKLERINEVNVADEFLAIYDLLIALGYKVDDLTTLSMAQIKYDIFQVLDNFKDPLPSVMKLFEEEK